MPELEPIWPHLHAEPLGAHDTAAARWILVIENAGGQTGVSSPLWSRRHAAQFARDQIAKGRQVIRVATPTGAVESEEIAEWLPSDERS